MTNAERAARRKAIAAAVKSGKTMEQVARRYGVTGGTVRDACKEHGVPIVRERVPHLPADAHWRILRALIDGRTHGEISRAEQVSRQRVSQIAAKAKEYGIYPAAPKQSRIIIAKLV